MIKAHGGGMAIFAPHGVEFHISPELMVLVRIEAGKLYISNIGTINKQDPSPKALCIEPKGTHLILIS